MGELEARVEWTGRTKPGLKDHWTEQNGDWRIDKTGEAPLIASGTWHETTIGSWHFMSLGAKRPDFPG